MMVRNAAGTVAGTAALWFTGANTTWAQDAGGQSLLDTIANIEIANSNIMVVVFMGAFAFAMWSATWLIRARRNLETNNRELALENADLKTRYDQAQALLNVPDQAVVVWGGADHPPICQGTLPVNLGAPQDPALFVAFGTWLAPQSAQDFEQAANRLRERAESFDLTIETRNGSVVEAQGRASGSYAFVRFIGLEGERAALANLETEHTKLLQTTDTMQSLLEAVPFPVWLRDEKGTLTWTNPSYVAAVNGQALDDVLAENIQLLDSGERVVIQAEHAEHERKSSTTHVQKRIPATIGGDRRMMDISEVRYAGGSAGLAVDMSEVEMVQGDLRRTLESHAQTMNQLASAVAIFDEKRHLIFHNRAFDTMWSLDSSVLDSQPDNGMLFDTLRDKGLLAEQPDWSKWRNNLLRVYEATQPQEHWWHLPDGRTLRVVANPHKQGGVTWVFENITEQLEMESRYIALTQVQGETLDHLVEAIAVFASDGRLKLSNPSFQNLWELEDEQVAAEAAIMDIAELCKQNMREPQIWDELITGITGISDMRKTVSGRFELIDGMVVDYALVPLPNGQTMLSFADVSASVNLEHTLKERNEALQAAEQLKNAFIEHVSYEFRAPLTNIKGFAEVLQQQAFGPLNEKQMEYVAHITSSSKVLHSLVDNLLDLATVDAGIMELDLQALNLRSCMSAAARTVAEQVREKRVKLTLRHNTNSEPGAGFIGDATRVQQILSNLLTNAVGFSPEGGVVVLESLVEPDTVTFKVRDNGPGISKDDRATIFERFRSRGEHGGRHGAGLGLSIARSLVELHGGTIELDETVTDGTCFVCRFPRQPKSDTVPAVEAAQ